MSEWCVEDSTRFQIPKKTPPTSNTDYGVSSTNPYANSILCLNQKCATGAPPIGGTNGGCSYYATSGGRVVNNQPGPPFYYALNNPYVKAYDSPLSWIINTKNVYSDLDHGPIGANVLGQTLSTGGAFSVGCNADNSGDVVINGGPIPGTGADKTGNHSSLQAEQAIGRPNNGEWAQGYPCPQIPNDGSNRSCDNKLRYGEREGHYTYSTPTTVPGATRDNGGAAWCSQRLPSGGGGYLGDPTSCCLGKIATGAGPTNITNNLDFQAAKSSIYGFTQYPAPNDYSASEPTAILGDPTTAGMYTCNPNYSNLGSTSCADQYVTPVCSDSRNRALWVPSPTDRSTSKGLCYAYATKSNDTTSTNRALHVQLATAALQDYYNRGGSIGSTDPEDSLYIATLLSTFGNQYDAEMSTLLGDMCSGYRREDLYEASARSDPASKNITQACGCHLPASEYPYSGDSLGGKNDIPQQCDTICLNKIPSSTAQCEATICVIDHNNISSINSSTGGSVGLNVICEGAPGGAKSVCYFEDDTILDEASTVVGNVGMTATCGSCWVQDPSNPERAIERSCTSSGGEGGGGGGGGATLGFGPWLYDHRKVVAIAIIGVLILAIIAAVLLATLT